MVNLSVDITRIYLSWGCRECLSITKLKDNKFWMVLNTHTQDNSYDLIRSLSIHETVVLNGNNN